MRAILAAASGALFALLLSLGAFFYALWVWRTWTDPGHPTDFIAYHTWAAMLRACPGAASLYDPTRVRAFLLTLRPASTEQYPFAYPPSFLLLLWPLGAFGWRLGGLLWGLAGLASYLGALAVAPGGGVRRGWILLAALAMPATALCLGQGQGGLLFAGLLAGGCALLPRRPIAAGVLFGLLACKPQYGLLVPVALLAGREWRAIAAAIATAFGMVLASMLAFGESLWWLWPRALAGLARRVAPDAALERMMPTVTGTLRLVYVASPWVFAAQAVAGAVAAGGVALVWRRGAARDATAVLASATFLATPYAFTYDLPALNVGLFAFALARVARGERLSWAECVVGGCWCCCRSR
ncbi:MAG: DUF2029 domain-containing protein [Rhodospirillales bacterium]|nr:DUF2029 domain-containing protein [Rhodospirillales bacterium]